MSSTASQISDFNLLRRCTKRSSKKNNSTISELYNNLYASQMVAVDQRAKMSPQRTISLGSLHHPSQTQFMEPRLSQLETLEAKMASIEVSLSATLKKPKKSLTPVIPSSPQTVMQKNIVSVKGIGYKTPTDNHDKENIARNNLKLQTHLVNETNDHSKHNQNVQSDTVNESEKQSLTQKIEILKSDMDQKRLAIKNIKMSLDQLDVTDNIDTRIQQAELEYQLGREELNLLSLMEETNKHKCRLEEMEQHTEQNENNTLYNYLVSNPGAVISLQAVEFEYDPKSPKFGIGLKKDKPGLFIDWTVDDLGFSKGDRLLEVNGKVVLSVKNKNDLNRLLEVSPSSVRVVVMHDGPTADQLELATLRRELDACRARAEETDRSRHAYKTENVKLSHRVSYLEDQVSELIKYRSTTNGGGDGSGVLFQRGSNSAMVRSKSPKHGVSAIQQYKRKQVVYDDRPVTATATQDGPVKTRIRTVPRLYGSSASVESLVSTADSVVAAKSFDDLHGVVVSPKRNKYPATRNSNRTRHIREAQQTLFRFLDSESSGDTLYLMQQQCGGGTAAASSTSTGGGSVRSLDLQQDAATESHRLKSTEYYSHLTASPSPSVCAGGSPHGSWSLNYDSEQSGRRAPMPPKKPLRLSLQQRHCNKNRVDDTDNKRHRHHRDNDDVDLSAINNTMSS